MRTKEEEERKGVGKGTGKGKRQTKGKGKEEKGKGFFLTVSRWCSCAVHKEDLVPRVWSSSAECRLCV